MTKEELKKKLEFLKNEVHDIWNKSFDKEDGWEWYKNHPKVKEYIETNREYKLVQDYNLVPHDDIGDLFTIEEFIDICKTGYLSDYDGSGFYATDTEQSNIYISPGDIFADKYRKDFTHVKWYNK